MKEDWKDTTLGDICDGTGGRIQTGPFGSQLHLSDYEEQGVPVIMPKDIISDKISKDTAAKINKNKAKQLKRHKLEIGDILFPRRGDIDKRALVDEKSEGTLCGTGCLKIHFGNSQISPSFIYFYLKQIGVVEWIRNMAIGSTMENLNTTILRKVPVLLPPLPTQQRIASILSAYDDLIEVNEQRIQLLEKSARQIYREWFVRFRFPGWEGVKFEKGVPVGWEVKKIGDIVTTLGGGTPSKVIPEFWGGDVNWFTPTDITGNSGIFLSESSEKCTTKGLNSSSANLFPPYSVMMTSRATIGAIGINTKEACTNQGFIVSIPNKQLPISYLYFWIELNKSTFEMLATGSTFLEISRSVFRNIPVCIPSPDIISKFHTLVHPFFTQIETLQKQNTQLRRIRDRLLPRLLSGKVEV